MHNEAMKMRNKNRNHMITESYRNSNFTHLK